MFFRRTQRRRPPKRRAPLAVRLRVGPGRRTRWRNVFLALLLAAVATGGLYVTGRAWTTARREFVEDSPFFALRNLEIFTEGHWITPEQVQGWIAVQLGENLLQLDLARIKHDLEVIPQVETVAIERVLPHLLRLRVTEREPVAQIQGVAMDDTAVAPVIFYVDAAGVVMPPLPPASLATETGRALAALPTLRGIGGRAVHAGARLEGASIRTALTLLAEWPRSPMAGLAELGVIEVGDPVVLTVTTTRDAVVTLGHDHLEQQFLRWRAIQRAGLAGTQEVKTLDLSVSNNCPVVWVAQGLQPSPPARPAKPVRVKRKHV